MDPDARGDHREPARGKTPAPFRGPSLSVRAERGADREVARQDPVFEVEVGIGRKDRMVVGLEKIFGRHRGEQARRERQETRLLSLDHLFEDFGW